MGNEWSERCKKINNQTQQSSTRRLGPIWKKNAYFVSCEDKCLAKECGDWDRVIDLLKFRFSQEKIRCIVYGQVTRLPRRYQRTIIASNSTLVTTENNFIGVPGENLRSTKCHWQSRYLNQ
jgi:hypothetical protein